jgi:cytochrome bd-type quinol oxidase subunit 2
MFSAGGLLMVFGVLLGLLFIGGSVYYVNKMFVDNTQEILVRFILLIFTALVALFIVDKVIAFKIKLLSDEQNRQLFDLIKTLVLMIFSYYFGTKETNGDKNKKDK